MKNSIERRKPKGFLDYFSLAITTFGVGYIPGAPGTYGSLVAVAIYVLIRSFLSDFNGLGLAIFSVALIVLTLFSLLGIWAAGRSIPLLGNQDPSEAVVDEVIGQLVTFMFIPLAAGWPFILAGFLLFRLFDIWKPYPIRKFERLSGGLGICADDIVAGIYAGICLVIAFAVILFVI